MMEVEQRFGGDIPQGIKPPKLECQKPIAPYSGLLVVIDEPSRFDRERLIDGWAGQFFDASFFNPSRPEIVVGRHNTQIQTLEYSKTHTRPEGTTCVLLLGQKSLEFFKPSAQLLAERGSPFDLNGLTCLASILPQDAMDRRNYFDEDETESEKADEKTTGATTRRKNFQFWLRKDIQKACRISQEDIKPNTIEHKLYPDLEEVYDYLTTTKNQKLFLDIETDKYLQMTCFGFAFGNDSGIIGNTVFVVPMLTYQKEYFYGQETWKILCALAIAMRDNTCVLHNASFDLFVLAYKYGIPFPKCLIDTMVSHHRLYAETEKSLGHAISLYTDLPYHKNTGIYEPHNHSQEEQLYRYNANDIIGTAEVFYGMQADIRRLKAEASIKQACDSICPYLLATLQGLAVDETKCAKKVEFNERLKAQYKRMLRILAGREINPSSWQQVSKYLYDKDIGLGFKPVGDSPTSEKSLQQLKLKHDLPTIGCILNYRGLTTETGKLKFKRWPTKAGLRCTGSYVITGTTSYRLSSRKLLGEWGTNLQNFEKGIRKLIVPDPGKVFVQVDQSGAEALIVAYLCPLGRFRQLFENKIKPHTYFALHQFRKVWEDRLGRSVAEYIESPIPSLSALSGWKELAALIKSSDEWPSKERYYYFSKQGCHSGNYDIRPPTFRLNVLLKSHGAIVLSNGESADILNGYHGLFPEIKNNFHRDIVSQVEKTRILRNLFGFPRVFTSYLDESAHKEWYAFIPQSTVGTITNIAFTCLQELCKDVDELKENGVDILQNNHDSILAQCNIGFEEKLAKLISHYLRACLINPKGEKFQMGSEAYVGESWGDMKEIKV